LRINAAAVAIVVARVAQTTFLLQNFPMLMGSTVSARLPPLHTLTLPHRDSRRIARISQALIRRRLPHHRPQDAALP
jgi:hypothetical protein